MKIGILTSGGDCPGINAAIRGVGKTAIMHYQMSVIGIHSGFTGITKQDYEILDERSLSGILNMGGTILGTSRDKAFRKELIADQDNIVDRLLESYHQMELDCIVCIGGNGTMKTANVVSQLGVNVVAIPKTIDNDIWGTEQTFGFDTATNIATEAIDRLHSTASSHKRVMVIEVMGHNTGWLALYAGIAGGGDVILLPELDFDINNVCDYITQRANQKKTYSIVVVAEGIKTPQGRKPAEFIGETISSVTGIETRETVLGHVQRGGNPSPFDRILATRFGAHATELIHNHEFGRMVCLQDNNITSIALSEIAGKLKYVEPDNDLILQGQQIGVCFG